MRWFPALAVSAAALVGTAAAPPASAHEPATHTVQPGDTVWGLATSQGMSPRAWAAANGLDPDAPLIAGTTVRLAGVAGGGPAAAATAPAAMGGYTVRPGDTLSRIAASSRIPLAQLAQMNGVDPSAALLAGTVLKLPTGAPAPAGAARPAPAATVVPAAAPAPSHAHVDAGTVASIAAEHGVPGSLAAAIGWQESGFNNAMVSSANARGVMQVMPGTWDWVQQHLASRPLDPSSASDNVHAGVLYLRSLLRSTGGDPATAAAAYYQGLSSVRRIGMLPETRRYVANVMALRGRFGG